MKAIISLLPLSLLGFTESQKNVYICVSPAAKKYHYLKLIEAYRNAHIQLGLLLYQKPLLRVTQFA